MNLNFKNWLESNDNTIKYGGFWNDGRIIVYINNVRYVFSTDSVYHNKWKAKIKYRPWEVLNDIKAQVKRGNAQQLEPVIAAPKIQQRLF